MNRAEIEAAILYAAADLPQDQRREYLRQVCDDDTLRREVEELLAALEKADSFLEPPPSRLERIIATATVGEKAGDRIGHYKLLQQIGEGGCGVVYIAEQEQPIQREVALKILKPGMDTKQVIVRFEAERQALAMMDHPNIARVFDAGATESGRPYFVMELARGSSITRYCDEQQLTIRERLELFVTICDAIQHAHQKGIIHRDIKPSNILITSNNGAAAPKVIDFGIAKATQGRLTDQTLFTAYEQFIGTPAYMSPEQAGMTGLDIDTRSDIYSLGVLLYELLTGRTPFDPKSLAESGIDGIRRTICDEEPPKPSTRLGLLAALEQTATASRRRTEPPKLIQSLKGDLDWIVMKALEKDRSHRYQTASGLGADVVRYLNNEPVTARPPSTLYRVQKLVQRNRLAVAAGVAVSAALILALAILGASNVRIRREQTRKDAALSVANASERRAKNELFTSLRSQARALRSSRQMGQRLGSLAALREAAKIKPDPGLRKEVIAALALPDIRLGPLFRLSRTNCAALTCDGMRQRYAAVLQDGTITVSALDNNREIYRFQTTRNGSEPFTTIKFSADGKFLVKAGDDQRPQVWSMHSGEEIRLNAPMGAAAPSFASDGRTLALSSGSNIVCYDLSTGVEKIRWKTHGRIHSIEFNPSEPQIAIGYKKGAIVSIYDAVDGSEVAKLDIGEAERTVTAWHPNARQLAVGNSEAGIQIWDAREQRRLAIFSDQVREVDYLTFHPSGDWLASWSWDGSLRVWDPTTRRVAMQALLEAKLQFSLDGRWLGFHWLREDAAQLIEFVAPYEYITLQKENPTGAVEYLSCAVNSDDRLLATASNTGVEVWDLKSRVPSWNRLTG